MTIGIQQITVIILIVWFVLFVTGKLQQGRIKIKLLERIQKGIDPAIKANPQLTLDEFYQWVFADWGRLVRKNAWFVLAPSELFPIAPRPEQMRTQMNLTPVWLGAFLAVKGHPSLVMTEAQQAGIQEILANTQEQRRRNAAIQDEK